MKRRPDLDAVRTIAVVCVLLYHMAPALVPHCWAGVDVFFVLSGYLIAGRVTRETPRAFVVRRLARIYPLFLVVALTAAIPSALVGLDLARRCLGLGDHVDYKSVHLWSVQVEILLYGTAVLARRAGSGWWAAGAAALTIAKCFVGGGPMAHLLRADGFLWGYALASREASSPDAWKVPLGTLAAVAVGLAIAPWSDKGATSCGALLLAMGCIASAPRVLMVLGESPAFGWIASRCLGLYLLQIPAISIDVPWWVQLGGLAVIVEVCWQTIELPIQAWAKAWVEHPPKVAEPSPAA